MKKKIFTGLLIGAFVFGIGAANAQSSGENFVDKVKASQDKFDKSKDKADKTKDKFGHKRDGDKSNRPEPPKDSNGNPIAPPNHYGDKSNRPEPPKDSNGNPIAPPNHDNRTEQK